MLPTVVTVTWSKDLEFGGLLSEIWGLFIKHQSFAAFSIVRKWVCVSRSVIDENFEPTAFVLAGRNEYC